MTSEYERGVRAAIEKTVKLKSRLLDGHIEFSDVEVCEVIEALLLSLLNAPAPVGVTVQELPPLTDEEKARLRNTAREMDIRNAARVLLECKTIKAMIAAGKPLDLVTALRALSEAQP